MKRRRVKLALVVAVVLGLVLLLSSCSPFYVMEAGMEEARILWRRKPIDALIADPATDDKLREKLKLVLAAREYAKSVGLKPEGSFTKFSQIDRDVLLYVLSGSSKVALAPVTWWFPIVGSIPYKGFFEKEDADAEANRLALKDYDTYLRPAAAFSTLGWFDDPLLSTTARYDEVALVNTVIHEILHNTIWVPDYAEFNETLANFVGSMGAEDFFKQREGEASERAADARKRWAVDLDFAHFLEDTVKELEPIYISKGHDIPKFTDEKYKEIVAKREAILEQAVERWESKYPVGEKARAKGTLNNAKIIAFQIYLKQPWKFVELYELTGSTLPGFVEEMKKVETRIKKEKKDPYEVLAAYIAEKRGSTREENSVK